MKRIVQLLALALSISVSFGASETQTLREILDKSITPGGVHEDRLEDNLKSWSGLHNIDGVAALFDLRLSTSNGHELLACAYIEKKLQVPKPEIAQFLMERAQSVTTDTYLLMRYLDYLSNYDDDPRVTKYYASQLSDKRPLNRNRVPVEGGHIVRVCDIAIKNLIKWLMKRNVLKWGDPGFVWDALHVNDFENNIKAIQPYLIKYGVVDGSSQADATNSANPQEPSGLKPSKELSFGENEAKTAGNDAGNLWPVWCAVVIAAVALLWLLFKLRKS